MTFKASYRRAAMNGSGSSDRVLILNPTSGRGDHGDPVRELATEAGFTVRETEEGGDAVRLAYEAAGADTVVACGGDGTVNAVVTGLRAADALADVEVGVVPGGTGNNFAENIGVTGIRQAFDVLATGDVRTIDLGVVADAAGAESPPAPAEERVFVNSCVGGLTADASSRTGSDSKARLGVLAYVLETLRTATDYDGLRLSVTPSDGEQWQGDALLLLVGNARRFPGEGRTQANVEDGAFDVVVIEERPATDLASEAAMAQLLGRDAPHLRRFRSPEVTVEVHEGETTFSLDGEMVTTGRLDLRTVPEALSVRVGEAYEPSPR